MSEITIIGGGLAGCEAAWQAACRGVGVRLYEMRPSAKTPAHTSDMLAELVCSNSFRSADTHNAVGLLKEEMRRLDSLLMRVAGATSVPAGSALAVDRDLFAGKVTEAISGHPLIEVVREEVTSLPETGVTIVASGPLTSDSLTRALLTVTNEDYLYFYDAIAPIVEADSLDMGVVFRASRYGKGGDDYLNCPFTEQEYQRFYDALMTAEKVPVRDFENPRFFEGCMPIEVMAERGRDTLRFGPMKPVGLTDPRTGRRPHAVLQLRQENREGSTYNLVGFQTRLKWGEQGRVFRLIPGLEDVRFARYGSMHRNTFINAPALLRPTLQLKERPNILMAGQVAGVEGYVESAAAGLLAGINAARLVTGVEPVTPPETTAHGALIRHLTQSDPKHFQPSNVNHGLFVPLEEHVRDKERRKAMMAERALEALDAWKRETGSLKVCQAS